MLTISPISANKLAKVPSFKAYDDDKASYEAERRFYEQQSQELNQVIEDENIPEGLKKPFKVARVITNGVIDGLAVGWATATGAKTCQKAVNSKIAKNIFKYVKEAIKTIKPLTGLALKGLEKIKGYAVKGLNILKNNKFGQKLTSLSDKLTNNSFTKKIINFTENISKKVVEIVKKVIKPIKNMTFEKATNITATTLGTGSGIAGAYVAAKEANPIQTVEDEE